MLRIRKTDVTPPPSQWGKGWHYRATDGTVLVGGDLPHLLRVVTDYRVANGLPVAGIEEDVHDWMCRNTEVRCKTAKPVLPGEKRSITLADVKRFLTAMAAWISNGTLVSQEEAERRAEICAGCRFQTDLAENCPSCAGVFGMIEGIIGGRKTRLDHELKHCGVCLCANKVSVWAPMDVLHRAHGGLEFPSDTTGDGTVACWEREDKAA